MGLILTTLFFLALASWFPADHAAFEGSSDFLSSFLLVYHLNCVALVCVLHPNIPV